MNCYGSVPIFEKKANWQPFSIVDGRLITGQNPASSTSAAQALMKLMTGSKSESQRTACKSSRRAIEMPPREGISIAHFLTVADIERSARFYETGLRRSHSEQRRRPGAPGYIQIANTWLIVNVGGGPTPDKPTVTLSVPDPNHINSFMNIRVADIQACYESMEKSRGRVHHRADPQVRRDALLHPRS